LLTRHIAYSLIISILFIGCTKDPAVKPVNDFTRNMPSEFSSVNYPADNAYTEARWELGKKLFYDPILSIDTSLSCASCHKSELAFSDNVAMSDGVKKRAGVRNSPTLANVAYHPYYTREGGVPSLEMQVLVPIQEHNEFDFNIVEAGERIANDPTYRAMSRLAYNRDPDYYVITRALANFERELISKNSYFDQYHFQKKETMTNDALLGMELFYSTKTHCFQCHGGPNFTNYTFQNNGLYETYTDEGRKRLTDKASDAALFKVPTLRNVVVTSPYMHDGSLKTIEAIINHYNNGGANHVNQSDFIKPLHLSASEKSQLVAFLEALTDEEFITNKKNKQ
jgi:cytochrome c peroxidase